MFDVVSKFILFLFDCEFEDGQIFGQCFFCWYSLLLEGVLLSIDGFDVQLDVCCIGFEWLCCEVIVEIGEQDQLLLKLVLLQGVYSVLVSGVYQDCQYVFGVELILVVLNGLFGIFVVYF